MVGYRLSPLSVAAALVPSPRVNLWTYPCLQPFRGGGTLLAVTVEWRPGARAQITEES
jgi:hypothetical protein